MSKTINLQKASRETLNYYDQYLQLSNNINSSTEKYCYFPDFQIFIYSETIYSFKLSSVLFLIFIFLLCLWKSSS